MTAALRFLGFFSSVSLRSASAVVLAAATAALPGTFAPAPASTTASSPFGTVIVRDEVPPSHIAPLPPRHFADEGTVSARFDAGRCTARTGAGESRMCPP